MYYKHVNVIMHFYCFAGHSLSNDNVPGPQDIFICAGDMLCGDASDSDALCLSQLASFSSFSN